MTPWDAFAREKVEKIFKEKRSIVDIGGGLRISKEKGNRYNKKNTQYEINYSFYLLVLPQFICPSTNFIEYFCTQCPDDHFPKCYKKMLDWSSTEFQ